MDLHTLSRLSNAVPAFQVLTVTAPEEANLETSVRSFMRHVTGTRNEAPKQMEIEKKRKRRDGSIAPSELSQMSNIMVDGISSPPKKYKNNEETMETGANGSSEKLPKSIESLYKSIMSAQEELEAGRNWSQDALGDL